jgi:hypothetical protein
VQFPSTAPFLNNKTYMNIEIIEIAKKIKQAKKNKEVLLLRGMLPDVPSWNDILENLSNRFKIQECASIQDSRMINDVLIYNKLDPQVFMAPDQTAFSHAANAVNIFNQLMDFSCSCIRSLINFVGNEAQYYIHADGHDVISWHCVGSIEWRIYTDASLENFSEPQTEITDNYDSYILRPGDVMYVPSGIVHKVVPFEPRVSLIFNYNEF